jgi:ATP-dependent Lon protease
VKYLDRIHNPKWKYQPVEAFVFFETSHLFSPLSDEVNHDAAFLDRINFVLPVGKSRNSVPQISQSFWISVPFLRNFEVTKKTTTATMHWINISLLAHI